MWMHGARAMWFLLLLSACATGSPRSVAGPVDAIDAGAVRPLTLRYRAVHRGDHPPWKYVAHVQIVRDTFGGEPAWRQTYRIEDLSPTGELPARWQTTTVVHRDTLALLAGEDVSGGSFGESRTHLVARGTRLVGESQARGSTKALDIALRGFVAKDVDLLALSVPLRRGYTMRFALINEANDGLRPFSLAVERQERLRVPAGEFDAWRIAVTPLDGDRRLTATYHVRGAGPRVVLRREYVVNPETRGKIRRSTGVEELEALQADLGRGR